MYVLLVQEVGGWYRVVCIIIKQQQNIHRKLGGRQQISPLLIAQFRSFEEREQQQQQTNIQFEEDIRGQIVLHIYILLLVKKSPPCVCLLLCLSSSNTPLLICPEIPVFHIYRYSQPFH
jgi:hypothetical protein